MISLIGLLLNKFGTRLDIWEVIKPDKNGRCISNGTDKREVNRT
jgi:hypothetical protein